MSISCCALIVAAGKGRRFGRGEAKQLAPLAGRPLLVWTLEAFERCEVIDAIVVVVASDQLERVRALVTEFRLGKVVQVHEGGEERYDSVLSGLAVLPEGAELVAIHDGARPLVTPELIARVVWEAKRHGAAVPALPARDTVKRGVNGLVSATEDRDELFLVQTPQVFTKDLIRRAYAAWHPADESAAVTDDAQLVERVGHPVRLVSGDPANIKITVPSDLRLAEALLGGEPATPLVRVGNGYDVHRFAPGRRLVLGGVEVDHPRGLLGHSDADVLCHAVGDAMLGAAGLGDLGLHFPSTDPGYRGARSLDLLAQIKEKVASAGLRLCNLDVTVICEQPRIEPLRQAMRENLARALGAPIESISVKATTTEGLGFEGRKEGIAAQAVVSLMPSGT